MVVFGIWLVSFGYIFWLYKFYRYCYLLIDLTSDSLATKCANYEELKDYLRLRGTEAYLQKRVSVFYFCFMGHLMEVL